MKKIIFVIVTVLSIIITATQQTYSQTGTFVNVRSQFIAGTVSGGVTPICYNINPGVLTSTAPTGGNGGYTYQWQDSISGGAWTNILGQTALTYNPGNLTANRSFRIVYTDLCGTLNSNKIDIVVRNQFVAGTVSGGTTPICYNINPGVLTSTAPTGGNGAYTYQWQDSISGGAWTNILGQTALTYNPGALTANRSFRIVYTDLCGTLNSNKIDIVVRPQFVAGTVTGGTTPICYNINPGVLTSTAPTGGNGAYTYQWQDSISGGAWTNILGQTALTYNPGALTANRSFRIVYTDLCGTLNSNKIDIVVRPQFVAGTVTGGTTPICYNINPGILTSTAPTGGNGAYTYQWQDSISGGAWTNIIGQTALTYNPGNLTANTSFRIVYTDLCGTLNSNKTNIVVYPVFNPGTVGNAQTICYNTAPALLVNLVSPTGGDGTYTYQWESSPNGFAPWSTILGANSASYQPPVLTTPVYYHRVVTSGSGCGSAPSLP